MIEGLVPSMSVMLQPQESTCTGVSFCIPKGDARGRKHFFAKRTIPSMTAVSSHFVNISYA